jgi:hypothetical protein
MKKYAKVRRYRDIGGRESNRKIVKNKQTIKEHIKTQKTNFNNKFKKRKKKFTILERIFMLIIGALVGLFSGYFFLLR